MNGAGALADPDEVRRHVRGVRKRALGIDLGRAREEAGEARLQGGVVRVAGQQLVVCGVGAVVHRSPFSTPRKARRGAEWVPARELRPGP